MVGPHLGPHRLRLRRVRHRQVRDGLLRAQPQVLRRLGRPAREPGRVHPRHARLLRRVPRRRLQPAHHGAAREGPRPGKLLGGRVRRRPPGHLPRRARRQGRRREDRGVPQRLRRLQHRPVLLPRQVRRPVHLPAHALLQEVQGGLPHGLQLRLRRPQQPLPVLRRRLRRHFLLQQQAIGVHIPQQQARVQWLRPTPDAGHVCSHDAPAALRLRGTAVLGLTQGRFDPASGFVCSVTCGYQNFFGGLRMGDSFSNCVFNRLVFCKISPCQTELKYVGVTSAIHVSFRNRS